MADASGLANFDLLAELVKRGALTEERCCDHARAEFREHGGTRYVICGSYGGGEVCKVRYVSRWEAE